MQERTENESKINYWYKQYLKAPAQLIGFGALIALGYIYTEQQRHEQEFRQYMATQLERSNEQNAALLLRIEEETKTLSQMTTQLGILNSRMGHVERELEIKRKENDETYRN